MNPTRLTVLLAALSLAACPEPTEPDPVDPVVDAGPAAPLYPDGTVTVVHIGIPVHLSLMAGSAWMQYPAYPDGGATFTGYSMPFIEGQASDTVTGSSGTASGTSSAQRVDGGVLFLHTANVQRNTEMLPTAAAMGENVILCIYGPAGKQARLEVRCEGIATFTGSGMSSLLVGGPADRRYCVGYTGALSSKPLPQTDGVTQALSDGKRCFEGSESPSISLIFSMPPLRSRG